jgi:hypothetical protein
MTVAADYQAEYSGLLMGPGTAYGLDDFAGLDDLPDSRTSDTPRPSDHGLFAGTDFAAGRTVDLTVKVEAASAALFRSALDSLIDVTDLQPAELPLTFRLPGMTANRRINVRPRRRAVMPAKGLYGKITRVALQFFATDPRVYADDETVLSTSAATTGGGRTYNRVYDLTYAAGGTGGSIAALNAGTFPTRPTLKITGPATTPRVENVEAGAFLAFNLTLAAGEFLVVDLAARTVLLGGTASRYSTLAIGSSWWQLPPGTSTIRFSSADSAGTLELRYRSAWL